MSIGTGSQNLTAKQFEATINKVENGDNSSLEKLDHELQILFKYHSITEGQFIELEADIGRKYR